MNIEIPNGSFSKVVYNFNKLKISNNKLKYENKKLRNEVELLHEIIKSNPINSYSKEKYLNEHIKHTKKD